MESGWLPLMLALPWVGAVIAASLRGEGRRGARLVSLVTMGAAGLILVPARAAGTVATTFQVPWISDLDVNLALRLDSVTFPFVCNLMLVSVGAVCYAWGYWQDEERPHLCYGLLLAFIGSMLGTLLADDMVLLFVFWEGMLVTSSLLLAGWGDGERVRSVTLKYFLYTQAGSLLLLASLAWIMIESGSSSMADLDVTLGHITDGRLVWMAGLMFVAFGIKLAIAPLHGWLPDAHSIAPMPVTILLAAAMLSMGAYGMVRFPIMILGQEGLAPLQLPLLLVALGSQVYGALLCFSCTDIKRIVAYSSVSQMGYVLFALATLSPQGIAGGLLHVINHGIVKALLFMGAGIIMRETGRRNIDQLGGLLKIMPAVSLVIFVGALDIAGMPPFSVFFGEWMILTGGLVSAYPVTGYVAFVAPLLTSAYALWLSSRLALGASPSGLSSKPSHWTMRWSAYCFGALALVAGLAPNTMIHWARQAASALTNRGWP